ncbi:MAG: thioredoxin family protein [Candidatus Kapabacteria bacterium]|nr:thioredoxin family protein [Candidatus Kapabacteria bacterium]
MLTRTGAGTSTRRKWNRTNSNGEALMTLNELVTLANEKGLTFEQFMTRAEARMHAGDPDDKFAAGRPLNYSRMTRHMKTYEPGEAVRAVMADVQVPQTWVVITEDWCGDSAQTLPVLAAVAGLNPLVSFRILDRDTYPEAIESYLTTGSRSIPIVVATQTDMAGNSEELWVWGPRPDAAKPLVTAWKNEHETNTDWYPLLHTWYSQNAHVHVESDILGRINALVQR